MTALQWAYKRAAEYRAVLPSSNETTMALSSLSELIIRGRFY